MRRSKRALSAALVDLAAIGLAVLFTSVMLLLFRLEHRQFEQKIQNIFDETAIDITLHNMLRTKVVLDSREVTFGELIAYYAATNDPKYRMKITEVLNDFKNRGINLFRFVIAPAQQTEVFEIGATGAQCNKITSATAVLPGIGPLEEFKAPNEKEIEVILECCSS